jgi:bloom syndrome protein
VVDDDFAPIRVAKSSRATKAKGMGAPITTDQRTQGLTEFQSDVLRDFMDGAKQLRKGIEEKKSHREAIFTDTVLREMGLDLPMDLDEMKTIPGIRPEMVDLYGRQFLVLINNTRNFYGDDTPVPSNPQLRNLRRQQSRVIHEIDDDDEEVVDQNHRLVVDLCSEDEDEEEEIPVAQDSEEESFYGDFDDEDDDDDGAVHTSHHFSQAPNPDVAAFNNRYTQLGGGAAPSIPKVTKAPAARGRLKASGSGYKKGSFRKRASFGKSAAGVKKRASKGSSSRASGGATTASKASSRGPRGGGAGAPSAWNGVLAMPT